MVAKSKSIVLAEYYPRLYHMSHQGSWGGIYRHGLLSTSALLDLFEVTGERRFQLESERRARSEVIVHPAHGRAILRDQQPLNERKLRSCLQDGLTPRNWYELLNRKVFFWGPPDRLKLLQAARLYHAHRQTIIEVDTARFLERYADRVSLCHMNSGSTQPMAFARGKQTFLPLEEYPLVQRRRDYGVKRAVAEITVEYAVRDLLDFVEVAYEVGGSEPREVVWKRQESISDRGARAVG